MSSQIDRSRGRTGSSERWGSPAGFASGSPTRATPAPAQPPFPRRPLRELLDEPGMSVTRLATGSTGDVSTLLLTPSGATAPRLVAKIPLTRSAEASLEREARMLVEMRRLELGRLRATTPRFVQLCQSGGRSVLVMSALPGRSLARAFCGRAAISHRRCRSAELDAAETWLAGFQDASWQGSGRVDMLPVARIERLSLLGRALREVDDGEKVADRARRVQVRLGRYDSPRSAIHGNFQAPQVLVDDRVVGVSGVIGWGRAATRGEPLVDVGRFAVTHESHRSVGRMVPGAAMLTGRGSHGAEARRFVQAGLVRLGLPDDLWYPVAWAAAAALLAEMDPQGGEPHRAAALARLLARSPDPAPAA